MTDQTPETNATPQNAEMPAADAMFTMKKLYVKDLSFEVPGAPDTFKLDYNPEIKMEMNSKSRSTGEDEYEVNLSVTLNAIQNEKTIFVVEVQQAGIFDIKGIDEINMRHTLSAYCPSILFPYLRETISNLVSRGGFPSLLLAPVNFDQLFLSQLEKEKQESETAQTSETEQ